MNLMWCDSCILMACDFGVMTSCDLSVGNWLQVLCKEWVASSMLVPCSIV